MGLTRSSESFKGEPQEGIKVNFESLKGEPQEGVKVNLSDNSTPKTP